MKPFEVSIETNRRLLRIAMRGFWDVPTFEIFAGEFVRALQALQRQGGCEAAIVDGREFSVQSKEILERFSIVMRENAAILAKRTASIVPTELNRMQANRVTESLTRADFNSVEEAEAWLFGTEADTGRAA